MRTNSIKSIRTFFLVTGFVAFFSACRVPAELRDTEAPVSPPGKFAGVIDSTGSAAVPWRRFFRDTLLTNLIDSALANNQELKVALREIGIARNEVRSRRGEYLPFVRLRAGGGVEKVGRYTSQGANDANTEIMPGKEFPEPLPDAAIAMEASWEVDIWKKLRNAKKSAMLRYLGTVDGKNFMVTNLVAEIASGYYELLALDNRLEILRQNIELQTEARKIMRMEKNAARVTELAVRKFEAEVFRNRSRMFEVMQEITETENHICFLTGTFPHPVERKSEDFLTRQLDTAFAGTPALLLQNRPDVLRAEKELAAAGLDVKVARAAFYPSLGLSAGLGLRAFHPELLFRAPESLIYSLAGDLLAPVVNRNAIKAGYYSAAARRNQQVYEYGRTVLLAFNDVANQVAKTRNLRWSFEQKHLQVVALNECTRISTVLFKSARADYMEVLMTQRDALEARSELVETRMQQLKTRVALYRAAGGGWR